MASTTRGEERDRTQHIQSLFQPIARGYPGLESLSIPEALELVELTQDTLDDVWKQTEFVKAYPEARMQHLLEVIGIQLLY